MSNPLKAIYRVLVMFGIDPRKALHSIRGLPLYLRDWMKLRKQQRATVNRFPFAALYPCLEDRFAESGSHKGHYFHQDLLVARRIFVNRPVRHIDVGSRVDGFVTHVAAFRPLEVIDIRPLPGPIPNVTFIQADLISEIPQALVSCCDSLSCLHALEHFGLGRYGDPVNYDGDLTAFRHLFSMLKPQGKFYFSVPIGPQRIEFNAHRVFAVANLLELFTGKFTVDQFSYVDDQGDLHENVSLDQTTAQNNYGCKFGCGIFELTKIAAAGKV